MNSQARLRLEYLVHIANGGLLACKCGEDDINALVGGHRDNDGSDHSMELIGISSHHRGLGSAQGMKALKKGGWSREHMDRLQIECWNCNSGRKKSVLRHYTAEEIAQEIERIERDRKRTGQ